MKRFFKKPTFVLLLVLLPTVALALALVAQEDSGFLHIALARESDLIVYAGYLMRYAPEGFSGFFGEELRTFHYFMCAGAEKSLGIGLGSPFMYYDYYTACPTFINAYNATPETQEAVVAALYGEIPMLGGEPFSLVPKEVKQYLKQLGLA